jgi:hypothetical protein
VFWHHRHGHSLARLRCAPSRPRNGTQPPRTNRALYIVKRRPMTNGTRRADKLANDRQSRPIQRYLVRRYYLGRRSIASTVATPPWRRIGSIAVGQDQFPSFDLRLPFCVCLIPSSCAQGISMQAFDVARRSGAERQISWSKHSEFPVFSQLSGNFDCETGSIGAASTTTQSDANRRFPVSDE